MRNEEVTRMAEQHEMNIAKRKREEEETMEDRNIKRTNAIRARTIVTVSFRYWGGG